MNAYNGKASALIVDDDQEACKSLESLINTLGIVSECETDPNLVIDQVKEKFYNVILLDVYLPGLSGIDLMSEILDLSQDTRVIIITGYGDKKTAVEALRRGAFDYLEKPVEFSLLSYSIRRALNTQKTELEFKRAYDDLVVYRSETEKLNKELVDTNTALTVLVKSIDYARHEVKTEIVGKMKSFVIPILERLQQENSLVPYRAELSALMDYIEDLASTRENGTRIASVLSSSELRIATLIKEGLTTDAIANHLCISPGTVKTHRKNIRKKLGINGHDQYLGDYLRAELGRGNGGKEVRPENN